MKKVIKRLTQIAAMIICAFIMFFNVSISGNDNSQNIDLGTVIKINNADAECSPLGTPGTTPGKCNVFERCRQDFDPPDCGVQ